VDEGVEVGDGVADLARTVGDGAPVVQALVFVEDPGGDVGGVRIRLPSAS